jgi:2',3'-cyclic-nucleotide 2'-phosphodiesterase (5'-nucleotidase family)
VNFFRHTFLLFIAVVLSSCTKNFSVTSFNTTYYNINNELPKDSATLAFIQPYADSLNKNMNTVIGYLQTDMPKAKPESLMGNFFCNALLQQSEKYFSEKADVCIMNYGGLRIPTLSKGNITTGKIFELMPFDNFLVLMKISGNKLEEVLHHIAADGGWPVSGLSFTIKNNKAQSILINGKAIDANKEYTLLISDYMAEGGDSLEMLKGINYNNSGIFVRDALIAYIQQQTLQGNTINAILDGRIRHAE